MDCSIALLSRLLWEHGCNFEVGSGTRPWGAIAQGASQWH